ncbi:3-oxoacyl-ACP reductase [Virgibacillus soli]|nr:3-oxoacyl-ACP reductase [Virgibacillus soli]
MKRLENRVALVTGGSSGIGAAIVHRLAEEGAHVAINYKADENRQQAENLKSQLEEKYSGKFIVVQANVGHKQEVDRMVDEVEDALGAVEVLVNNAGIAPFQPFLHVTEELWDETYQTNVKSIFLTSQRAAKKMIENQYGKIINIASTASVLVTSPVVPHYISSKAAANQLTKALAIELGRYNINVNAVGPSTVDTDMCRDYLANPEIREQEVQANPMKRLGTEKQIGDAVVFLASDEAMQINGHLLMVDGGLTVKAAQPEDHMQEEREAIQ